MEQQSWSLGEARSLAIKAARGAGYSWGLAEEAGFAVVWLQSRGAPGVEALAIMLDERAKRKRSGAAIDQAVCPIHFGASLVDGADMLPKTPFQLEQPILLTPFIATAASPEAFSLHWNDRAIRFSTLGLNWPEEADLIVSDVVDCTLSLSAPPHNTTCHTRVPFKAKAAMRRLAVHAHNTYAPATEQSRLAGAGAGTSDND